MSGNQTMINCASLKVGIAIIGVQNIDVQNIEITGWGKNYSSILAFPNYVT